MMACAAASIQLVRSFFGAVPMSKGTANEPSGGGLGADTVLSFRRKIQASGRYGLPSDIGEFNRIVLALREMTTNTTMVAQ